MITIRTAIAALLLSITGLSPVFAQSNPGWTYGYVPTTAQWNAMWASKQDYAGAPPCLSTGCTMTGPLVVAASTPTHSGLNLPPGILPSAPNDGDLWTTASGLYVRISGVTVGPLSSATGGSFAATSPITVSFAAGTTTYACPTCGVTGSPLSQFAATTSAQLAGVLSDETGTGLAVFNNGPTIASPTFTTSFTATGLIGLTNLAAQNANTVLANATSGSASPTAYAMPSCVGSANALQWTTNSGFSCQAITAAAGSVAVGTTTITGGSIGNVFYHAASNLLGEMTTTGSGTVLALATSPVFTTPNVGAATATSINGVTISSSTGTLTIANLKTLTANNSITIAGVDGKTATFTNSLGFSGTDGNTFAFPNGSDTVVTLTAAQNMTNKTLTSPTLVTPALGVAGATSIAINGCTIGTNGLCITGTAAISSTLTSAAHTITSAASGALAVGPSGATNPTLQVDASTASAATGLKIKSAAAGAGLALSVITSGTNENLAIDAAGSGTITLGGVSTGAITLTRATTISAALTYGGVTLSNSVTGTGAMVLANAPTFSGNVVSGGALAVSSSSSAAFTVGASNNAFIVDASSSAAGVKVVGAATGGTAAIVAIDSGANTNLTINAKGTGTIGIGSVSTGAVTIKPALTLSAALTYGGVTLSNSVTGTGAMVLSISPTVTGHMTVEGVTATGATGTGKFVFDTNPTISNLTVTSAFTATGLVTYANMASAAIATGANVISGASSVLVPASSIYNAETTTTYGTTTTFDFSTFINTAVTLTGNITTQTLSNVTAGKAGVIRFIQDATGSRTTVWNSIFKFSGGVTPSLSTAANAVDALVYNCISTTYCPASLIKDVK